MRRTRAGAGAVLVVLVLAGASLLHLATVLLGLGLVAAGLTGLWRRPQWGVLALAALAPYDGLLLIVPHPQIVKSWKEGLVLAVLIMTFVGRSEARAPAGRRRPGWLPAVVGLVAVGAASCLTVSPVQAITGFRIDFFYLLLAWAVWRCPLDGRERDRLVSILMVNGVITSLVGIAQQALGAGRLASMGYTYNDVIRFAGGHLRSFSTFNQPFPFAFYVMAVLLVGLPVALADTRRTRNRLFLLCLPILGVGMLTSIVRAAWIGAGVGWIFLGLRRHRILLVAVPFALVALLYLPGTLSTPALSGNSLGERTSTWGANLSHLVANPLGSGIGSTGAAQQKTASLTGAPVTSASLLQPDNYYYKEVYELGLPGLYFLLLLFLSALWETTRISGATQGKKSALALGVAASVLAAAVASLVSTYFEIYPMDLTFYLLISVVATYDPGRRRADERRGVLAAA